MPDEDPELAAIRARLARELAAPPPPAPPAAPPAEVLTVTDATLADAVRAHARLVVDCWAVWCGPCRVVAPIVEELARDMAGRVVFAKLDVDQNPRTAMQFAVQSIPTLLLFERGRLAHRVVGAVPKRELEAAIRQAFRPAGATPGPRRR